MLEGDDVTMDVNTSMKGSVLGDKGNALMHATDEDWNLSGNDNDGGKAGASKESTNSTLEVHARTEGTASEQIQVRLFVS